MIITVLLVVAFRLLTEKVGIFLRESYPVLDKVSFGALFVLLCYFAWRKFRSRDRKVAALEFMLYALLFFLLFLAMLPAP